MIRARSTVHLLGLPLGRVATVDASDPYIAELLEAKMLVPEGPGADAHPRD